MPTAASASAPPPAPTPMPTSSAVDRPDELAAAVDVDGALVVDAEPLEVVEAAAEPVAEVLSAAATVEGAGLTPGTTRTGDDTWSPYVVSCVGDAGVSISQCCVSLAPRPH